MARAFKEAGVARVVFHSDGDIRAILDDLVDAGIDAINPVEPRANMDVVELRKRYGNRLAFFGLCSSKILPYGTREEVRAHVENALRAGEGGGLIIGSASIGTDISLERYEFVMQILAEHGRPLPPFQSLNS
jgi:uroporphyrinogen decarboxylase